MEQATAQEVNIDSVMEQLQVTKINTSYDINKQIQAYKEEMRLQEIKEREEQEQKERNLSQIMDVIQQA